MVKVATNEEVVLNLTKSMGKSSSQVSFSPKKEISFSESQAVTTLKESIVSMKKATNQFKSSIKIDNENLVKIHETIKKTDENL